MTLEVASIRGGSRLDSFVVRVVNTSDGTADGHFSAFTSFTIGSGFVAGHEHAGFRCQQRWQQYESDRSPSRYQRDGIYAMKAIQPKHTRSVADAVSDSRSNETMKIWFSPYPVTGWSDTGNQLCLLYYDSSSNSLYLGGSYATK